MNKRHQVHFDVSPEMYAELDKLLPARGQKTNVLRRMIHNYIKATKEFKIGDENPVDLASAQAIEDDRKRGII